MAGLEGLILGHPCLLVGLFWSVFLLAFSRVPDGLTPICPHWKTSHSTILSLLLEPLPKWNIHVHVLTGTDFGRAQTKPLIDERKLVIKYALHKHLLYVRHCPMFRYKKYIIITYSRKFFPLNSHQNKIVPHTLQASVLFLFWLNYLGTLLLFIFTCVENKSPEGVGMPVHCGLGTLPAWMLGWPQQCGPLKKPLEHKREYSEEYWQWIWQTPG